MTEPLRSRVKRFACDDCGWSFHLPPHIGEVELERHKINASRSLASHPEDVRVELDQHGATVVPVGNGLHQVWCDSHATASVHPDRARQERRAATHNAGWHPELRLESGHGAECDCLACNPQR